ncbi:hypothetical protein C8R26_11565 [Nitrosomonas oligotropha]|jgi:hypothetical protein|uniref:Transmembrane protein n=1 Tax=Nitrosomonas oligotropha TaxID=42354 RepID=A0A2T5HYM4_9PROT|nr:hypothetical protein C8R26_11565 [Nitrosomonas oligotropha]
MDASFLKTGTIQTQLDRLMLQLRWQAGRLGTIGKIGLGLIVVAGIYFFSAVLPQDSDLQKLKERAETLQLQELAKQSPGEMESGKKLNSDQALQVFYDYFPRIDSSPFWIRELVQLAKKHGVDLSSSEYRLMNESDARLARYEMILPVKGRYPQIRAFMAEALVKVPAMAISAIALKRENITSDKLEVRLEINLYLNK